MSLALTGVLGAAAYLAGTSTQYEAIAKLEMAQIRDYTGGGNEFVLARVETAELLIERLRTPSTYPPAVLKACGLEASSSAGERMTQIVNSAARGPSIAVLMIRRAKPDLAERCAGELFEMIRTQQGVLLKSYQDQLKATVDRLQKELSEYQGYVVSREKSGPSRSMPVGGETMMLALIRQIGELQQSLLSTSETRLITPIYVSRKPVSPKPIPILLIGVVAGLMLGFALAAGRGLYGRARRVV